MGYVKAENILPEELIVLIQQYADGINIYIPRKDNRIGWGEGNQTKKRLFERDSTIFNEYINGARVSELAEKYFLSEKRIQSILRDMKKLQNEVI